VPTGSRTVLAAQGAAVALGSVAPTVGVKTEIPVDHQTIGLQSQPSAGGVMSVALPAADVGYVLKIERIGVSVANSVNPTICTVYVGDAVPQNQADFTPDGNQDQADEFNPILVPGGLPLTIVWTGASNGAIGYARVQYTLAVVVRGAVGGPSGS
jgi:hypothetical protein